MIDFFQTGYGKRFFEYQLPRLIDALSTIAEKLPSTPTDAPLDTVNVIMTKNGLLEKVRSYADTPQGNKKAEAVFIEWIKETGMDKTFDMDDEYYEVAIESGVICDKQGNEVLLSHSER